MSIKDFNSQSTGEEISNAISHGIGALLTIAGTVLMIIKACFESTALGIVSVSLYGASMIVLYTCSTLYHSLTNYKAKRVFQILDHCSIFFLILGTYIPISLLLVGGAWGWTLVGINMACAVLGIVFNAIDLNRWHKLSLVLYVIMGWLVVMGFKYVYEAVPFDGLLFLIAGGVLYTVGIYFYKSHRKKYMHFIWHIFVLLGSLLNFFFVYGYCI